MVLPGIQALFGFQLIAVFTEGFVQQLAERERALHMLAILLVVVAIGLVMAPAALHRQTQLHTLDERFVRLASGMLLASIVGRVIFAGAGVSAMIGTVMLAILAGLWLLFPRYQRWRWSRTKPSDTSNR